ncbi:MAG: hypothetical protein M0C28_47135 [Candidatus Moduliflexus flocculans]|nr:hypothetical protein [Candidatus Moduliflexus flocculans]
MDIKGIAEQLVKRCLKKGADAAEVYIETGRNLSLDVRKGDIETVQEAAAAGAGIRVFVQGRMAFASSNDLGEKALEEAAGRAIAFARVTTADPNNVLPDDPGVTEVAGLYDPRIAQVPMEEKIELIKSLEKLALKDPRITKSDGAELPGIRRRGGHRQLERPRQGLQVDGLRRAASRSSPRRASRSRRAAIPATAASTATSSPPRRSRPRPPARLTRCSTRGPSRPSGPRSSSTPTSPGPCSAGSWGRSTASASCRGRASWRKCWGRRSARSS